MNSRCKFLHRSFRPIFKVCSFVCILLLYYYCILKERKPLLQVLQDNASSNYFENFTSEIALRSQTSPNICFFNQIGVDATFSSICKFKVIWNSETIQVRRSIIPPTFIGRNSYMEDVHSSWLSNYSYKKYDWNSFPDLLNISGPRRTGLLTLDNAYVDIWAPSV